MRNLNFFSCFLGRIGIYLYFCGQLVYLWTAISVAFHAALLAIGADVYAEEQTSDGRMDIVMKTLDAIYIVEFKYEKTALEATAQILNKGYTVRFTSDVSPVYAIGLNISQDRRTIESYEIKNVKD